jgi:DNA-binding transcriptional MerR regulator
LTGNSERIAAVAKAYRVYYERIALLRAPARSAGRYRVYDTGDVRRPGFIRRARELGFTLDEVHRIDGRTTRH